MSEYVTYEKIHVVVVKADIKEFDGKVDCFVNTTNTKMETRSQISKTINDAGGKLYEDACDRVRQRASELKTTECIATVAGHMKTPNIIHAMCPVHSDYMFKTSNKEMKDDVFSTVFNCLKMAEEMGVQSIAIPFISTGNGQLDIGICSEQYACAILEFSRLRENRFVVEAIYFIDMNENKVDIANKVFKQIIPISGLELLEVPKKEIAFVTDVYNCITEHVYDTVLDATDEGDTVDGQRSSEYNEHTAFEEDMEITDEIEDNKAIPVHVIKPEENETETYEEIQEFCKNVGRYKIIIEKNDIRNSKMMAIVCPENEGIERGGLLAAAIKCTFRQAFDERKLSKIQKKAIATTEYPTKSGTMKYILHVMVPIWKDGIDEIQLEKKLKEATVMIFDKLIRHKKRNISSIALPLLGIGSVENDEIVGKCCKWQIEQVVEILQRKKEIPNLKEVRLINRCEKIRNTLITHLEVCLSH